MPQYPSQAEYHYDPDNLIAGTTQIVSETGTLIAGQNLKRGAVVGKITVGGKFTLSTTAATDGSQAPYGILYDDYDATAGDVICGVYVKAEVNENALVLGAGWTLAALRAPLRDVGIYLKGVVTTTGAYL